MTTRSRCLAAFLGIVLAAQTAFGADDTTRSLLRLKPGALVHVMPKTAPGFDAIFITRDGDRVLFELMNPDESIAMPVDALLEVRPVRPSQSASAGRWELIGGVAGFFASILLLRATIYIR